MPSINKNATESYLTAYGRRTIMCKENSKDIRTVPCGAITNFKPGSNQILLRLQPLAVVYSTEKSLSISA